MEMDLQSLQKPIKVLWVKTREVLQIKLNRKLDKVRAKFLKGKNHKNPFKIYQEDSTLFNL